MQAITYWPSGRLGNQLHLFACARTLAWRHDLKFIYQSVTEEKCFGFSGRYRVSRWFHQYVKWVHRFKLDDALRHQYLETPDWDTSGGEGFLSPSLLKKANTLFILTWNGNFKNLGRFRDALKKEIRPVNYQSAYPAFPATHVGVHIRRDDGMYPLSLSWYVDVLRKIAEESNVLPVIHLFTDGDKEQLGDELRRSGLCSSIVFHIGSPAEDMLQLSRMTVIVCSMSWFSFYAAFLSDNSRVFVHPGFPEYPGWTIVSASSTRSEG